MARTVARYMVQTLKQSGVKRVFGLRGKLRPRQSHLINGLFDCHRSRVPVLAIGPPGERGGGRTISAKSADPMVPIMRVHAGNRLVARPPVD
ncbi:MAG: hypothetical protein WCB44_19325 [Stellaceae bacterium]